MGQDGQDPSVLPPGKAEQEALLCLPRCVPLLVLMDGWVLLSG